MRWVLALLLVHTVAIKAASANMREPNDALVARLDARNDGEQSVGPGAVFVRGLFYTYQRLAGPSKGTRCPMTPSCSEYARIQVKQKGLVVGILEAGDRLHRCGHDLHLYKRVYLTVGEAREDKPD